MNKDQKKAHRNRIKAQARLRKQQDRDLLDELEEDMKEEETLNAEGETQNEESESEDSQKEEEVEKEYSEDGLWLGPTSFEELDAMETAREQAYEVNKVSWSVQDLVYNIVRHPLLDPKEKNKAIQKVGTGFEKRIGAILDGKVEKDLDLLSIEAILAHDARNTGVMEKARDFIQKKTLTSSARNKLSGEQFALPEKRKYPIHDKAHVRNALARAAQQIKAGGEGAADAKAALPKIRAAAKKFGIEMDTDKEKTGIVIEKDASETWRWVGWSTNKFMDFDGEILAEDAHKEFCGWLDENPEMAPVFMTWHTPDTIRKNAVDFWMYENGFLIMSGPLTDEEAAGLMRVQKEIDLGMSHGAIVLRRDPDNRKIITKYRMYEVSDLPLENAANPFTSLETVTKEAGMDKQKYFKELFGEDKAEKYLTLTKETEQKLEDAGVQHKEQKAEDAKKNAEGRMQKEETSAASAATQESKINLDELVKAVGEKYGMEELNAYITTLAETAEKVPVLEGLVKALAENQDQALAEKISPPASSFVWMNKSRASQSDASKLKEDDEADKKLKKSAPTLDPETDWLSAQTNTQPVRMQ